ncbi:MAG: NAD(P)H-dependent oxidoreductase [Mogibacterium sp.]|nr:NAD(P)H-dependent oxidoreductase [Mogibacterium sp.]
MSDCAPSDSLLVIKPTCDDAERAARMEAVLAPHLEALSAGGTAVRIIRTVDEIDLSSLAGARILFAFCLSASGVNMEYYRLLEFLRAHPLCLSGCIGGILVDGGGEFYTKAIARRFAFSANQAGCTFPGKALVEATGSLGNFCVLSKVTQTEPLQVYRNQVGALIQKVLQFKMPSDASQILAVHASSRKTSNTLLLWDKVKSHLPEQNSIKEVSLRNGELYDCRGCSYETCLHFGEQASCFYGGVMTEQAFPAILSSDILVMICPNYNDAVSANLTAFINRLTAIFRSHDFTQKRIYALIVSGYSGGDIIAEQLIGALCFNKEFILPPAFAMLETANDPESILTVPDIESKARAFAEHLR